jgi:oligosaccharide repeat unit polymerase
MGISNLLGLEERGQGIYAEYMQVGKNGYHGISNVFTAFRPLIEDFGEAGSYAVMFILGFVSKLSLKYLTAGRMIYLNQTVLSAVYAYLIWSFAASFFAYTSYLAMFFLAYFLFRMLQKETVPC